VQVNPRKNAWISLDSFGRIGTFQGVTANPNKKIFPSLNSRYGLCSKPSWRDTFSSFHPGVHRARVNKDVCNTDF
jgi:hypothetical protein